MALMIGILSNGSKMKRNEKRRGNCVGNVNCSSYPAEHVVSHKNEAWFDLFQ